MMKSLYSGVAGLKTHNQRMDVIGNNISNVNTVAFKASAVTFKDIFYQHKTYASSGDVTRGGKNANQIGYGASLSQVSQVMTQSGFSYSDKTEDCAIQGEGFFQVMDSAGNIYYTRNGAFHIDDVGNLCDANGYIVLGVSGDPTGVDASSQRINLYVPSIDNKNASVTKTVNGYTFTASASTPGEEGNISLTIVDGDAPFAVQNGMTITVTMDLDQDFADEAEFNEALYAAMVAGGVDLGEGVLPITFEYQSMPNDIQAVQASNTLNQPCSVESVDADNNQIVTTNYGNIKLTFTAEKAGELANTYEINLVGSKGVSEVKARWSESVLTITVPDNDDEDISLADIQAAITAAAGDDVNKLITVTSASTGSDGNALAAGTAISADQVGYLVDNNVTARVGLENGKDNFFKSMAEVMGTIKLTDGREASEQTTQDLESIFIDEDGVIYGVHTVHGTIAMGRIDLVTFENPEGLDQVGTSYWKESLSSGEAQVKIAASMGVGSIVSGALELSNTDLSQEISDMIITQRGFQANSRVITVTDTMLEELVNLKR